MKITVRSYDDDVRKTLLDGIERIAEAQAKSAGLPDDLMWRVKGNYRLQTIHPSLRLK